MIRGRKQPSTAGLEATRELVRDGLRLWRAGEDLGLVLQQLLAEAYDLGAGDAARLPWDERPTVRRDLHAEQQAELGQAPTLPGKPR